MPKTEKTPHPRSRKAEQIVKKSVHKLRRTEHENKKNANNKVLQKQCLFYHDYVKNLERKYKEEHPNYATVPVAKKRLSPEEMHEMIEAFLQSRKKKWEERLDKKRGKATTKLQIAASQLQEYEKGAGLRAPDLLSKDTYKKFVLWDGQVNTLTGMKMQIFKSPTSITNIWSEVDKKLKTAGTEVKDKQQLEAMQD